MLVVWANAPITRRKSFHLVTDMEGNVIWRSKDWDDLLVWLRNEGITEYTLCGRKAGCYDVTMTRRTLKGS